MSGLCFVLFWHQSILPMNFSVTLKPLLGILEKKPHQPNRNYLTTTKQRPPSNAYVFKSASCPCMYCIWVVCDNKSFAVHWCLYDLMLALFGNSNYFLEWYDKMIYEYDLKFSLNLKNVLHWLLTTNQYSRPQLMKMLPVTIGFELHLLILMDMCFHFWYRTFV